MNFLTIGHRGAMGHEPENTLRSFVRAERSGVDLIELDLHLSKDGALVVMHDAEVD
ncbi:glycerophosphodiester phosphodiesterase, partial [Streptomyces sp. NRRL F-6602]